MRETGALEILFIIMIILSLNQRLVQTDMASFCLRLNETTVPLLKSETVLTLQTIASLLNSETGSNDSLFAKITETRGCRNQRLVHCCKL